MARLTKMRMYKQLKDITSFKTLQVISLRYMYTVDNYKSMYIM